LVRADQRVQRPDGERRPLQPGGIHLIADDHCPASMILTSLFDDPTQGRWLNINEALTLCANVQTTLSLALKLQLSNAMRRDDPCWP
jgi:hypothetical protein